ncbi:uncharacterized protein LOC128190600 isoform X1 [Crassostrea angulata]|uniref:uncharacterized protein LOC128190600 isoform X1 n=1 Tax=Magallana angulata TaxID=2784310 RepID=UPI0022B1D950|nr:uncharacterized protein LOC128190600 isoform X1 [Crassostrea angulata]
MFNPFRHPMLSLGEDDEPSFPIGIGSSQYSNGGPPHGILMIGSSNGGPTHGMLMIRSREYKCHRGHNHNDQGEVEHCNRMSMMTLLASKPNRCHQGHEHANSREVTECNELEEKIQRMRTESSASELRFRQTITDIDGRTIQNEIEYRGNPERLRGLFGNNPALGQSGGMSLSNFPFN